MKDNVVDYGHLAVLVSDIERSARWYADVMGWEPLFEMEMTDGSLGRYNDLGGNGRIAMGAIAGARVEFVQMYDAPIAAPPAEAHYGLFLVSARVHDLDLARERCRALGVTISRDLPADGLLFLRDPDGQEVCLIGWPTSG